MADDLTITLRWAEEAAAQMAARGGRGGGARQEADEQKKLDKEVTVERQHNLEEENRRRRKSAAESAAFDRKMVNANARAMTEAYNKSQKEITDQHAKNWKIRVRDAVAAQELTANKEKAFQKEIADARLKAGRDADRKLGQARVEASREATRKVGDLERSLDEQTKSRSRGRARFERELARDIAKARKEAAIPIEKAVSEAKIEGAQRASDFVKSLDEKDAALDRSIAQKRKLQARDDAQGQLEQYAKLAEGQAKVAQGAIEEMKVADRNYRKFQKAGDKEGMESSRQYFKRRSQDAKEAAENAAKYTRAAEREMGDALKHRTEEDRINFRRRNQALIDGTKDATKKVVGDYQEIGREGTKTMGAVASSTSKASAAADEHGKAIKSVGQGYFVMHAAAHAAQALNHVWTAVAQSTRETDDYIKRIVQDMRAMRDSMAEILAMRGMPQSAGAAAQVADEAAAAHVGVADYTAFQTKLTEDIANITEPPELAKITEKDMANMSPQEEGAARAEKAKYPIGADQRRRLEQWAIPYIKSQGLSMEAGGAIFATTVAVTPRGKDGRIGDKEFKDEFARNVESLQKDRGEASKTAIQFDRLIQEFAHNGMAPEQLREFRQKFSATSQAKPQQAAVLVENFESAMSDILNDEKKRDELGIGENSSKLEAFDALMKYVEKEQVRTPKVDTETIVRRMIGNQRAARGFAAIYNIGVKGGGNKRQEALERKIDASTAEKKAKEYLDSPGAYVATGGSKKAAAASRAAADKERFEGFEAEVEAGVIGAGELETYETEWQAVLSLAGKGKSFESREQLFYYQETGQELQRRLMAYQDDDKVAAFLDRTADGARLMTSLEHPIPNRNLQIEAFNTLIEAEKRRQARGGGKQAGAGAILRRARANASRFVAETDKAMARGGLPSNDDAASVGRQTIAILKRQLGGNAPAQGKMSDSDYAQHLAAALADRNAILSGMAPPPAAAKPLSPTAQGLLERNVPLPGQDHGRVLHLVLPPGITAADGLASHIGGHHEAVRHRYFLNARGDLRRYRVPEAERPRDYSSRFQRQARWMARHAGREFERTGIPVDSDLIHAANASRHGMHKVNPDKVGKEWFVDEHGKLRHTPRMRGVPIDAMRGMPVTWNVRPSPSDAVAANSRVAAMDRAVRQAGGTVAPHGGHDGLADAARELRHAARDMRRHVPAALPAAPSNRQRH